MREMIGKEGEKNLSKIGMEQMLVSMGHQSSGAGTLWNFPSWMRNLVPHDIDGDDRPDSIDMAALDSMFIPVDFFCILFSSYTHANFLNEQFIETERGEFRGTMSSEGIC